MVDWEVIKSMTAREFKPNMKTRLVFWLKEVLSGKAKKRTEQRNQGEEDLDWLYRLNPAINELLDVIGAVPDAIKEGVVNYIVIRMLKRLYPLRHPRLSKLIGAQICANLEGRQDGLDYILPQIRGDESAEVTTIESLVDDLETIYG